MTSGSKLSITSGSAGGTVVMDGQDISTSLYGLSVHLDARTPPAVTLDVLVHDLSTDMDNARIQIPAATHDLLVRLGWTPPKEAADVLD